MQENILKEAKRGDVFITKNNTRVIVIKQLKNGNFRCILDTESEYGDGIEWYDINGVLTGYYADGRHYLDISHKEENQPFYTTSKIEKIKNEFYNNGYNDALKEIQRAINAVKHK